jgi:hypothetical protein
VRSTEVGLPVALSEEMTSVADRAPPVAGGESTIGHVVPPPSRLADAGSGLFVRG